MSIENSIRTYLIAQSAVDTLIDTRAFCGYVDESFSGMPNIIIKAVSRSREPHMTAASGLVRSSIQIDCNSTSYVDSKDLADKVRLEMDGFINAAMGTETVQAVMLENETDLYYQPPDGGNVKAVSVIQDYDVWHTETVPTF
jgi:hypothetical protein